MFLIVLHEHEPKLFHINYVKGAELETLRYREEKVEDILQDNRIGGLDFVCKRDGYRKLDVVIRLISDGFITLRLH